MFIYKYLRKVLEKVQLINEKQGDIIQIRVQMHLLITLE